MRRLFSLLFAVAAVSLSTSAGATPVVLSSHSSDVTPASILDATFDFSVAGMNLTIVVTNDTTAPYEFNINEMFFNASGNVTSLMLTSAMHSVEGNVMADWMPVVTDMMVDGFSTFDYGLMNMMGEIDPSVIGPAEYVTFVFGITGTGPFTADDFIQPNSQDLTAAAKFVNGPGDDSAWGAVPEPSTALLLASGLLLLGARRRFRR
jgi:hypothetical protein